MKREKTIEVPESVLKNIIHYCESQSVYDKLGAYGDFYYKLKYMLNHPCNVTDYNAKIKSLAQEAFDVTTDSELHDITIASICIADNCICTPENWFEESNNFEILQEKWGSAKFNVWLNELYELLKHFEYDPYDHYSDVDPGTTLYKKITRCLYFVEDED